jgi:hypothetical protein
MTDAAKAPNGEHKVESPTSVYAVASTAPQMSMGRWVKDSDLEAQTKQHSKVNLPLRGHITDGILSLPILPRARI